VDWDHLIWNGQSEMDKGFASTVELVVWVETKEEREKLEVLTREAAEHLFLKGEVLAQFEVRVEVHPSRAGRRDREDGWAGTSIESWR